MVLAPADVVQRVGRVQAHGLPHPVGDERVDRDALVHLVEVWQRVVGVQHPGAVAAGHRGPGHVVEQPLDQVAGRCQVLEALLVLDADGVEAEVVADPQRGDVHLVLPPQLSLGELARLVGPGAERHARLGEPAPHSIRLGVGDRLHLGPQRALRQPLLVDPERVQQLVVDDRVVHPHAAFVEDTDDGLLVEQLLRERDTQLALRAAGQLGQVADVALVVLDAPRPDPRGDAVTEPPVSPVDRPQRGVLVTHLRHAGVKAEQADQPRPPPGEVRHGEHRPAVAAEPGEHVVAVLPDRLGYHERRVQRDAGEHVQTHALAEDEAVTNAVVNLVRPLHAPAVLGQRVGDHALELLLRLPAGDVRRVAQVPGRDQIDGALRYLRARGAVGKGVRHDAPWEWVSSTSSWVSSRVAG